jgi:hypothetical protein
MCLEHSIFRAKSGNGRLWTTVRITSRHSRLKEGGCFKYATHSCVALQGRTSCGMVAFMVHQDRYEGARM